MGKEQNLLKQYTFYYETQLEQLIGRRMAELDPLYKRLQKAAVDHLEELGDELAKASDAVRASKRYRVLMQEAYVSSLLPDLQLLEAAQQPYFTEVLAGTMQYGYYTAAYTLEKAAMVKSTVRVLSRSGVLGMLANPWLPDQRTYSDRIRTNVQLVADKTAETVKDLVTRRLNYSEAAKDLSAKIGESYYNATRLVRTEMKRANSLGASYAAMDNADILDGKYWDATLDGKTSARCAENDVAARNGEIFDLDYDTPANPGVPGKRIPNHPHCRCIYVNKLRYLDPIKKRKAQGDDGKSYVTDAETYDDYAKERGLPSVSEMLESDNPKRYLRPGETVESLKQKVERKQFNGHTITASRAPWDTTNKITAVDNTIDSAKMNVTGGFIPAKTAKEATAWGRANLGIGNVDYAGFHVDVANDVNKTLLELRTRFPQITDTKIVSTSQSLCTLKYEADLRKYIENAVKMGYEEDYAKKMALSRYGVKKKKVPGNVYAWSTNSTWGELEGISFNKKFAGSVDDFTRALLNDVRVGYHPVGTATPAAVLTHEFGHQIDNYLKKKNVRGWVDHLFEEMQREALPLIHDQKLTADQAYSQLLSRYGAKNSAEFFAEAFSEYIHNPNPRPIAKKVGEKLEECLKGVTM